MTATAGLSRLSCQLFVTAALWLTVCSWLCSFFLKGRKFRQPAYLATSFSLAVAKDFIRRATSTSKVLWRVRLPSHHSQALSSCAGWCAAGRCG